MHKKAIEWDKDRGYDNTFGGNGPRWPADMPVPKGRPCDGCGEPMDDGRFIHIKCLEKESSFWLDLLY
jgi:hypothetical protein